MSSRRAFLQQSYNGLGTLGLASLLAQDNHVHAATSNPFAPRVAHLPRRAKRCIFLFMQGGVSQMDSFEYKPELNKLHGKQLPGNPNVRGELQGRLSFEHVCVGSAFKFQQHGSQVVTSQSCFHTWRNKSIAWHLYTALKRTTKTTGPRHSMSPQEVNFLEAPQLGRGWPMAWAVKTRTCPPTW